MKTLAFLLLLVVFSAVPVKVFALGNGTGTTATPAATSAQINNVTSGNFALNQMSTIDANLMKTGPQLANSLTSASGQLFTYLAVIALVLFSVKELMFGDKGAKEFMIFILFLAFTRGLLAGYQLFFVGTVNMFYSLGQLVGGVQDPMTLFQNIFYDFYQILSTQLQSVHLNLYDLAGMIPTLVLYFAGIIFLLIAFFMVAGTIFLVQAYIVIALVSGYIFVPFMVIKPLEFLWNGWLKFLLSSAIAYFLIFVVLKMFNLFMLSTLMTYVQTLNSNTVYSINSLVNELSYTFILLLFGYLVTKIPGIAGEIVSGMPNMSITAVIAPVTSVVNKFGQGAGRAAGKTVDQVRSMAGRGK